LIAGEGRERASIFFTLGLDDAHLKRNMAYLKSRAYAIEILRRSVYGPDLWETVKGKNIKVIDVGAEVRQQLATGDTSLGVNIGHATIPY
jgi:hypothetical protein